MGVHAYLALMLNYALKLVSSQTMCYEAVVC